MKVTILDTLSKYQDWLRKAKYELSRYRDSNSVYDLANCLLTLNALPEWVAKSDNAPSKLRDIANSKLSIMRGEQGFQLSSDKLNLIDHQLRFIRLFCNHAKHGDPKELLPQITLCEPIPVVFPNKFDHIHIGNKFIPVVPIVESVIHFWEKEVAGA